PQPLDILKTSDNSVLDADPVASGEQAGEEADEGDGSSGGPQEDRLEQVRADWGGCGWCAAAGSCSATGTTSKPPVQLLEPRGDRVDALAAAAHQFGDGDLPAVPVRADVPEDSPSPCRTTGHRETSRWRPG
ncbi:hypothetical protein AB0K74_46765, partial [Streptomyces sp. NPDC056159]|uniref:hypothetical protein n=1 Tax=Streptomyces sp. NPDC056159 TaxID=3155537 RepID=UPI0034141FAB